MYKTEADFVRSLSSRLKQINFDVTRLESHGTSVGIPDMFVQGHGFDFWIEAKNKKLIWRPGQIPWHYNYFLSHKRNKCVLTLIAAKPHLIIVPGIKAWQNNKPDFAWYIDWKDLSKIPLVSLLLCLTTVHTSFETYRQAIEWTATYYFHDDLDWDPDAIWSADIDVDEDFDWFVWEQYKCEIFMTFNRIYRNQRNLD